MIKNIQDNLKELQLLLKGLTGEQYTTKLDVLNGSSIGQHIRHILEFYQCLLIAKHEKEVNYDERRRDLNLESNILFASTTIDGIISEIDEISCDFALSFVANYSINENAKPIVIHTSFYRELAYNLEHSVHHQALIKVAILEMKLTGLVRPDFGYAPSTIRHQQKICAQ